MHCFGYDDILTSTTTTTDPAIPDSSELIEKKFEKLQFSSPLNELRITMDPSPMEVMPNFPAFKQQFGVTLNNLMGESVLTSSSAWSRCKKSQVAPARCAALQSQSSVTSSTSAGGLVMNNIPTTSNTWMTLQKCDLAAAQEKLVL